MGFGHVEKWRNAVCVFVAVISLEVNGCIRSWLGFNACCFIGLQENGTSYSFDLGRLRQCSGTRQVNQRMQLGPSHFRYSSPHIGRLQPLMDLKNGLLDELGLEVSHFRGILGALIETVVCNDGWGFHKKCSPRRGTITVYYYCLWVIGWNVEGLVGFC